MNIRQLRYISMVAKNGLNMSTTAEKLYTSQPGVSKQIKQLEDELGVQIFERRGRQITRVTAAGEAVIEQADRVLIEIESLRRAAKEFSDPGSGDISMAMTHTVARYAFPPIVQAFSQRYPRVKIHFHLATPSQIADQVSKGTVNFGIATEVMTYFEDLISLPCYRWRRAVLVPAGHPLSQENPLTLAALARYPLATYTFGFDPGAPLDTAFRSEGLSPEVSFTATDADVIKTYVRLGHGVGIVAALAYDQTLDTDLHCIDASHLFEVSIAHIVFRRGSFIRQHMYDFLNIFAPHLTEEVIRTAQSPKGKANLTALLENTELPLY